jgi:DNA repair exonuclease SbcCD ATPase subunit
MDFQLGSVNIFGGPNGFGKTSFFDAVLWGLFDSIPRLGGTRDFTIAAEILQNKFSTTAYSVELMFRINSKTLAVKRAKNSFVAELEGRVLAESDLAALLGLGAEQSIERFQRTFLLQQERVNSFVRELNPRGRYDAMVSLLQFQAPKTISDRLKDISTAVTGRFDEVQRTLVSLDRRLEELKTDVDALSTIQKTTSEQVIDQRYQVLISSAEKRTLRILGLGSVHEPAPPSRERILKLTLLTSAALQEMRGVRSQITSLTQLRERVSSVPSPDVVSVEFEAARAQFENTQGSLKKVRDDLAVCRKQALDQQSRVETARKEESQLRGLLGEVQGIVTSDVCPVCLRPIARSELLTIIKKQLGSEGAAYSSLVAELNRVEGNRRELELTERQLNQDLEQQRNKTARLRSGLEDRRKYDSELEALKSSNLVVQWELFSTDLDQTLQSLNAAIVKVDSIHQGAIELLGLVDQLDAVALLPSKIAELGTIQNDALSRRSTESAWRTTLATLHKCQDAVSKSQEDLVQSILERQKPLVLSLYKRLHPHPLFTEIDFEVGHAYGGGELYFKVFSPGRKVSAYPPTVFSTSQLNSLAVCVFIALNLNAESPLEIMMLDDPIHSMDDLNVLGFCDLMRQLKKYRQIFISTHSRDLYGLLLSKLRPADANEKVKGFWFEGWSEDGPAIREETVDYVQTGVDQQDLAQVGKTLPK